MSFVSEILVVIWVMGVLVIDSIFCLILRIDLTASTDKWVIICSFEAPCVSYQGWRISHLDEGAICFWWCTSMGSERSTRGNSKIKHFNKRIRTCTNMERSEGGTMWAMAWEVAKNRWQKESWRTSAWSAGESREGTTTVKWKLVRGLWSTASGHHHLLRGVASVSFSPIGKL